MIVSHRWLVALKMFGIPAMMFVLGCYFAEPSAGQPPTLGPPAITQLPLPGGPQSPASPVSELPPESLEEAWQTALGSDQRVEASEWSVTSSQSTRAAAQAEQFPSLRVGADYYMLSEQPTFSLTISPLTAQLPFVNKDSVGFHAMVTQPIYTFGRFSAE